MKGMKIEIGIPTAADGFSPVPELGSLSNFTNFEMKGGRSWPCQRGHDHVATPPWPYHRSHANGDMTKWPRHPGLATVAKPTWT